VHWYHWYLEPWKKYAEFRGRARRAEYWTFELVNDGIFLALIIPIALAEHYDPYSIRLSDTTLGVLVVMMMAGVFFRVAHFIPSLAVTVRRLHDTGHSGAWLLLCLVPLIGFLVLLWAMLMESGPPNEYDVPPKRHRRRRDRTDLIRPVA